MAERKRVAIMQPYFLPYIGYWQLMHSVDVFVVYDNIKFTKKGWINRNRYLLDGADAIFSIPLTKGSDYLSIAERRVADSFESEGKKLIRKLESAYRKAPFFDEGMEVFRSCVEMPDRNLFEFIFKSILKVKATLKIDTELVISSELEINCDLVGQDRVIATCKALAATDYINPIGGMALYSKQVFSDAGIQLHFQRVRPYQFLQFDQEFIPHLSIIDVLMFNGRIGAQAMLPKMDLC